VVSCDRGGASGSVVARWAQPEDALPPCRHSSSCFPRSEAIPRMRAMNKSEEERSNGHYDSMDKKVRTQRERERERERKIKTARGHKASRKARLARFRETVSIRLSSGLNLTGSKFGSRVIFTSPGQRK